MVRIGGSTEKGEHIKEWDYYTPSGEFRVDSEGSPTLLNCLMYKMCYYRFGQVYTEGGKKIFAFYFGFGLAPLDSARGKEKRENGKRVQGKTSD
jgi:hypothetical protein